MLPMRHVVSAAEFDRSAVDDLFRRADQLSVSITPSLRGKILASVFYEPSTRTRLSFESAMRRLGGDVITSENAREFSSAAKGETLEDSVRVLGAYADAIVMRHHEEGAAARAAAVSGVPVINAGDGPGEHPTQALLDLYTIKREIGRADGVTVAFVGDLKHGRTVRSLARLLGLCRDARVVFVSPPALRIGADVREYLQARGVDFKETDDLAAALRVADVVYQTRIQKERFASLAEYEAQKGCYVLTAEAVSRMRPGAVVLHPLPRVDEIHPEVDALPQAAYFRQAGYGVLVRMALLERVLLG